MTLNPQIGTLQIARELQELEQTLADALQRASNLTATMTRVRIETGHDIAVGHEPLMRATKLQGTLLTACAEAARVHSSARRIGRELGYLDEQCPPSKAALREVA